MKGAPIWTGVVIGLLLGLLLGSFWLVMRERQTAPALAAGPAAAVPDSEVSRAAPVVVLPPASAGGDSDSALRQGRRTAIVAATEKVAPTVVSINVIEHRTVRRSMAPPGFEMWERFYPGLFSSREYRQDVQSFGSGFIVSADGYVVTNFHVVEDADEIVVTLSDGRQFEASVLETVPGYDLALLKIEGDDFPVCSLASSRDLQTGEWAIAIGSPFGYLLADTQPTVTVGVISALNRDIKQTEGGRNYLGMIQTDAAINPGNSGGPLVDADGQVVGINTFIFTQSGGSIGIGFAVPIDRARWLIEEVRRYGRYRQPYSGIELQKLSPRIVRALGLNDPVGFIVRDLVEGSPAWKAGLRVGDIVRKINGVPLDTRDTVIRLVYEAKVGTRLRLEAERDGNPFTAEVVLEEMQRQDQR
jgi:serine protease Do